MSRRDPDQRPTKAERREQARLERRRIEREMAVRRRNRRIAAIVLTFAVVAGIGAVVVSAVRAPDLPEPGALLRRADASAQEAGCGEVQITDAYGGVADPADPAYRDRSHVEALPPLATYPTVPPTSGPHGDSTHAAGVYSEPPPMERILHSLEHGAVVVWYDPDAPGGEIARIRDFYRQNEPVGQDRVIVAPFDYPDAGEAGLLGPDAQMALVGWRRLQTCAEPSLGAAFGFSSQYASPTYGGRPYQGEAPEAGAAI